MVAGRPVSGRPRGREVLLAVSNKDIMQLRERTGAGVMDCKRALEQANGDLDQAAKVLREQGIQAAQKKSAREARQGLVHSYIHGGGRIGVLVEVNCETDFVARTDGFRALAHDIAMQIAATNPTYVSEEEMDEALKDQAGERPDPAEACLLSQPFIKDPKLTMRDVVTNGIATLGENIQVRRFQRFELGQ